ncbi:hypothetical protein WJX82_001285 [Trebouxia sp. C0006]
MTVFQFAENFWQPDEPDRRTLGQGGASNGVERCFVRATGEEFAAKRLSVLPRVVKYIELSALRTGEAFLILELVRGTSLCKLQTNSCLPVVSAVPSIPQHEQELMEIAAQLLQTVHLLHVGSNTAHLDISSSNIMHCTEGYYAWDQLRLVDFGFSQICTKGIVMFELLTGELPFKAAEESKADTDTSDVSSHYKHPWEDYCFFAAQQTWVDACDLAQETQTEVQHPLLDKLIVAWCLKIRIS